VEVYHVPEVEAEAGRQAADAEATVAQPLSAQAEDEFEEVVGAIGRGRMGCQAVAMRLPEQSGSYPLLRRPCVVVVGGENGYEDGQFRPEARLFNSALVYDVKAKQWSEGSEEASSIPPLPTARTAMAVCLAPGRPVGYPR
jgi:hypothetical protein